MKMFRIETDKLRPNPDNLFPPLPDDEYEDLKSSIAVHGIQEPLIVIPQDDDYYTILAGHNRWRVAQELSLRAVPCIVTEAEMYEAVVDSEIYRRMLSKEERATFKILKVDKHKELMEKRLSVQLIPELMNRYNEKQMDMKTALIYAHMPKNIQQDQLVGIAIQKPQTQTDIIVNEDPVEKEKRLQEKAAMMDQLESLQEQFAKLTAKDREQTEKMVQKDTELRTLRHQQDLAREALVEKMDELKTVKQDALTQAGKTLRQEVEEEVKKALEQTESYKNAVIEKNREIDDLRENNDKVKRMLKDADGKANAAWVEARVWRDDCVESIKKIFAPYTLLNHINAASQSIETVSNLLDGYNWDPATREKSTHELKRIATRIDEILRMLPNASTALPLLPGLANKQKMAASE